MLVVSLLEQLSRAWPDVEFSVATETRESIERQCGGANVSCRSTFAQAAAGADLAFYPLGTIPTNAPADLPTVTIVYDLQHRAHPEFFSDDDREARERDYRRTCAVADRIICISDFVRNEVLETGLAVPESVAAIPIRFDRQLAVTPDGVVEALGLKPNEYLFYPANFWEHKNHEILLLALGIFFKSRGASALKCICTGYPSARKRAIEESARAMGLGDKVLFPGYLDRDALLAVLGGCKALIFPTLYEGFGMPVAEAILNDKPVLASRIPPIEEAAGDAALYFDPKKPREISSRIGEFEDDPALQMTLIERGRARAVTLSDVDDATRRYRRAFEEACGLLN